MNIILSDKEKEFFKELKSKGNEFSYSGRDNEFRQKWKEEISRFIDIGLLEHYNQDSEGAYIRYRVTDLANQFL